MVYSWLLALHNLTRWLVLGFGFWAAYRMVGGWRSGRAWTERDRRSLHIFAQVIGVQFILGVLVYFVPGTLSSAVRGAAPLAAIMKDRVLRFFIVEHPFQMFIAVAIAQGAERAASSAADDRRKFRRGSLMLLLTLLLILAAIPWPFLSHGRPLLRLPW